MIENPTKMMSNSCKAFIYIPISAFPAVVTAVSNAKNSTAQVAMHKNNVPNTEPMFIIQEDIFVSPIQDIKNATNL